MFCILKNNPAMLKILESKIMEYALLLLFAIVIAQGFVFSGLSDKLVRWGALTLMLYYFIRIVLSSDHGNSVGESPSFA